MEHPFVLEDVYASLYACCVHIFHCRDSSKECYVLAKRVHVIIEFPLKI